MDVIPGYSRACGRLCGPVSRVLSALAFACLMAFGVVAGSGSLQAAAQSVIDPDIDSDGDGINNRWDPDDDNDGYTDDIDPDPFDPAIPSYVPTPTTIDPDADSDGDGIKNSHDPDDDNDGGTDIEDPAPFDPIDPTPVPVATEAPPDPGNPAAPPAGPSASSGGNAEPPSSTAKSTSPSGGVKVAALPNTGAGRGGVTPREISPLVLALLSGTATMLGLAVRRAPMGRAVRPANQR